jgi:DNA-binding response OmpR family regulator
MAGYGTAHLRLPASLHRAGVTNPARTDTLAVMRIIVIEDEADLASALAKGLRREGYAVDIAGEGAEALDRMVYTPYDLVLLDLNLPGIDGLEVCRRIRAQADPQPRVLMLTARDGLDDRVVGLDEGADDYMVKPFDFPELLARVRALVRRDRSGSAVIVVQALRLDAARHEASYGGTALELTAKEFALLRYFMLHPGEVITPERLLDHVWDEHADPFTNTVRVTVSNLRRRLRVAGGSDVIETVVGSGYRLQDTP